MGCIFWFWFLVEIACYTVDLDLGVLLWVGLFYLF